MTIGLTWIELWSLDPQVAVGDFEKSRRNLSLPRGQPSMDNLIASQRERSKVGVSCLDGLHYLI